MPRTDNFTAVSTAIENAAFDELLGTVESIDVEYKSELYRFSQQEQVVEFVKDVCSLLNAEGGLIVVGIRTHRFQTIASEVATGYIPFKSSKFDVPKMIQLLNEHTHPQIGAEDVDISFVPDPRITPGTVGILVIRISQSRLRGGPILVRTEESWGVPALIYPRRTANCQTEYPLDELIIG